jgi:hypothetical protein
MIFITTNNQNYTFDENVNGLPEITAESEITWNNIMQETLLLEHKAILTEDNNLLNEAGDNFFTRVKEWVKDKARKIKEFFKNLFDRFKRIFHKENKYVEEHKEEIKKAVSANMTVKVETTKHFKVNGAYIYKRFELIFKNIEKIQRVTDINLLEKSVSNFFKDRNSKDIQDYKNKIREECVKVESLTIAYNTARLKAAQDDITHSNELMTAMRLKEKRLSNELLTIQDLCEAAMKANEGHNEKGYQEDYKHIQLLKNLHSITENLTSFFISLISELIAEDTKIVSAFAKAGNQI